MQPVLCSSTLVFLRGSCSVGKSSLCKELAKCDPQWKYVSEDDFCISQFIEFLLKLFPVQMKTISQAIARENMFNAINRYEVLFKDNATYEEQQQAWKAIAEIKTYLDDPCNNNQRKAIGLKTKYSILEHVYYYLVCGFNVIVDSWMFTQEEIDQFRKDFNMTHRVFAYCPLKFVLARLKERYTIAINQKNFHEKKVYKQALSSYFAKVQPAKEESALDVISRQEIEGAIEDIMAHIASLPPRECGKNKQFSRSEFSQEELQEFIQEVYKNFGFDSRDVIAIEPAEKHDFIIRTDEGDPQQCAQLLLKWLSESNL